MGRDDHGHAVVLQPSDDIEHLGDQFRIERRGHFVEEHELRLCGERPDYGDTLLFAAAEPVRILADFVLEPEVVEQLLGLGLGLGLAHSMDLARAQRDVVEDRHVGEQVEGLEDDPHVFPDLVGVHAGRRDVRAVEEDGSGVNRNEEVDALQHGGLARTRGADQAHDFVGSNRQADVAQHLLALKGLGDALQFEFGSGHVLTDCFFRRSRFVYQSVNRATGTLTRRNSSAAAM